MRTQNACLIHTHSHKHFLLCFSHVSAFYLTWTHFYSQWWSSMETWAAKDQSCSKCRWARMWKHITKCKYVMCLWTADCLNCKNIYQLSGYCERYFWLNKIKCYPSVQCVQALGGRCTKKTCCGFKLKNKHFHVCLFCKLYFYLARCKYPKLQISRAEICLIFLTAWLKYFLYMYKA